MATLCLLYLRGNRVGICEKWVSKRLTHCSMSYDLLNVLPLGSDHPHLVIPVFNWLLILANFILSF